MLEHGLLPAEQRNVILAMQVHILELKLYLAHCVKREHGQQLVRRRQCYSVPAAMEGHTPLLVRHPVLHVWPVSFQIQALRLV